MSFLTDVPVNFTRREVIELRDLFVIAYPRPVAAEQLAYSAGLAPGLFPLHDNMRLIWTDLLRVMANQGKLHELVVRASEDPTAAGFQHRFAEMLAATPPVKASNLPPPVGWWKGDDTNPIRAQKLYEERLMEKRNRMLPVDIARQLGQVARSVAKLEMRTAKGVHVHGTGFLIQPDLVLTNHHNLFEQDGTPIQSLTADFDDEPGIAPEQHLVVGGKIETIYGDDAHDWAVIQLQQSVTRAPLPLGSPYSVGLNDTLIIIQHPLGGQKQFSLDAMAVRYSDDQVIQYVADTQKGSSGSPVFNSKMHIVALHHAEVEVTLDVRGQKEVVWRNEGIHICQVIKGL